MFYLVCYKKETEVRLFEISESYAAKFRPAKRSEGFSVPGPIFDRVVSSPNLFCVQSDV